MCKIRAYVYANLNLSRFFEKVWKVRWGFDGEEGDFCLKIWPFLFIFYKWSSPTVVWCWNKDYNPVFLNDMNSKSIYHKMPGTNDIV